MLIRSLIPLLTAGAVLAGVAHADAAEFIFRYRGMGPQVAMVEPETFATRSDFVFENIAGSVIDRDGDGLVGVGDGIQFSFDYRNTSDLPPGAVEVWTVHGQATCAGEHCTVDVPQVLVDLAATNASGLHSDMMLYAWGVHDDGLCPASSVWQPGCLVKSVAAYFDFK